MRYCWETWKNALGLVVLCRGLTQIGWHCLKAEQKPTCGRWWGLRTVLSFNLRLACNHNQPTNQQLRLNHLSNPSIALHLISWAHIYTGPWVAYCCPLSSWDFRRAAALQQGEAGDTARHGSFDGKQVCLIPPKEWCHGGSRSSVLAKVKCFPGMHALL
jgi:hypothetical protein